MRLVFNKSVSWVRVRDDHILTVDQITFIADERFHAYHATENGATQSSATSTLSNQRRQLVGSTQKMNSASAGSGTGATDNTGNINSSTNSANAPWTLQIKYVQARDAGIYECQISAEPKISARVYLHVVGKWPGCIQSFSILYFFSREFRFQENRLCCFIELKLPSFWEFSVYFDILTLFDAFLSDFFSLSSRLKCVNSFCIKFLRYWYSLQFQKPSPSAILFVM